MGLKTNKGACLLTLYVICILLSSSFTPLLMVQTKATSNQTIDFLYTLSFSHPNFQEVIINNTAFVHIQVKDCMISAEPGDPALPMYPIHIVIPKNHKIQEISIQPDQTIDYSTQVKNHQLFPEQQDTPISDPQPLKKFIFNKEIYQKSASHPSEQYTLKGTSNLKGFPVETIHVSPLHYNPGEKTLFFYPKITIQISFQQQTNNHSLKNQFLRKNPSDIKQIKDFVLNPNMVDSHLSDDETQTDTTLSNNFFSTNSALDDAYPGGLCTSTETIDYVIVTNNDLADTTGYLYNWTDLINHRENTDGLTGRIVTIEDIDACADYQNDTPVFDDSAAHLREFCKDAYLDWNTQYVLFGGDWQTNQESRQIVPCRIMTDRDESGSYDTMPSDLYFSNLDGDWYYETDNIWGGGRYGANDKLSELSVGRLPVWNAEMISNAIQKIIWYDNCENENFLRSAGFLGGNLGWTSTSKEYMEEIRTGNGSFSEYTGFEEWNTLFSEYILDTSGRFYDADYPTESDAVTAWKNAINNNELSLISHLDHGSWVNTLSLLDGSSLSNSHFFLGTSQACLSGRYTSGTSGASTFIASWDDRGAFAMVLNTGYGYGSEYSTAGKSQLQHKIWWDYFFANQTTSFDNWRLGKAMQYTKDVFSSFIDSFSHVYSYVWYSWNLFGDPAQQIRITVEENTEPTISSPSPSNNAHDVSLNLTTLSAIITDDDGDQMNWSIETSPDIGKTSENQESNGTKTCFINNLSYDTRYTWYINVTDGIGWTNETYQFTTESSHSNQPPTLSHISPANGSTNVDVLLNTVSLTIQDPEGDNLTYTIQGSYINDTIENNVSNTSITADLLLPLPYNTEINWYVNLSDGLNSVNATFTFTTRPQYMVDPPTQFHGETMNRTSICLRWTKNPSAEITRIERNTISDWNIGEGTLVFNNTQNTTFDSELNPGNSYHYQAWSYNITDHVFSVDSISTLNTTRRNNPVSFSNLSIENNTMDSLLNLTWSIQINDTDGDFFNWTIVLNNTCNNQSTLDTNGTKTLTISNLSYNTTYQIWVNATDGFNNTKKWYQFTTTIETDTQSPALSPLRINTSLPLDTDQTYGWENISCETTDNHQVSFVQLNVTLPDNSTQYHLLSQIPGTNTWFVNTTFTQIGNYSLLLYAEDMQGNKNTSTIHSFSLAPNWDVNMDGLSNLFDFNNISAVYGSEGTCGWIREDVDNNGKINVLDLTLVSQQYENGWW